MDDQERDPESGHGRSRLGVLVGRLLREASPAGVCLVAWVADTAGLSRSDAAALLAGGLNPPIEVADAVLRACTGQSLGAVTGALGC